MSEDQALAARVGRAIFDSIAQALRADEFSEADLVYNTYENAKPEIWTKIGEVAIRAAAAGAIVVWERGTGMRHETKRLPADERPDPAEGWKKAEPSHP